MVSAENTREGGGWEGTLESELDVLLGFVDEVLHELGARVVGKFLVKRVQEVQHAGGDDSLLEFAARGGEGRGFAEVVGRIGLVAEGALGDAGELAVVTVIKDCAVFVRMEVV